MRRRYDLASRAAQEDLLDWCGILTCCGTRPSFGREEYMQRLLASLILGEAASGWNRPRPPSDLGAGFIRELHGLCFDATPDAQPVFVDEFELPARTDSERSGWPDHAAIWPERLFLIEPKTERRSHRVDQLPYYLELAHHHHPRKPVDLLYITPTMTVAPPEPLPDRARYGWLPWTEVASLVLQLWSPTDTWERVVAQRLIWWVEQCEAAAPLPVRALQPYIPAGPASKSNRPVSPTLEHSQPEEKSMDDPMLLARDVQLDGKERAIETDETAPEGLEQLRVELRDQLLAGPVIDGTRITHVRPWLWRRATSGGRPLSTQGAETGYEIRLSRYTKPQATGS
jgi:hypothetical protein